MDHGPRLAPVQNTVDHIEAEAVRRFKGMSSDDRFRFFPARRVMGTSGFREIDDLNHMKHRLRDLR